MAAGDEKVSHNFRSRHENPRTKSCKIMAVPNGFLVPLKKNALLEW